MSVHWTLRLALALLLFALILAGSRLLGDRHAHEKSLENTGLAIFFVVLYNACCYLIVGIPPDPAMIAPPRFMRDPNTMSRLRALALALLGAGFFCVTATVLQRRVIGGQNTARGLITSGLYRFSRHPIYLGIVLVSLAIALLGANVDGLIAFPVVVLANMWQASIEEGLDIGARFEDEYQRYRQRTWMFGPPWFWMLPAVAVVFAVLA